MSTPTTLAEFFTQRGCTAESDIRNALELARLMLQRDLDPKLRAQIQEALIDHVQIAVREAAAGGPAFVVSAAHRARRERAESATKFAATRARDAMAAAGFAPDDFELNADDVTRMVRAEVNRILAEFELEDAYEE